jgi:Ca2+-transporting ATPase
MNAWSLTPEQVLKELNSRESGLSEEEAGKRIEKEVIQKKNGFVKIFFKEITEPMILLLLFIGVLYSLWGGFIDALTIFIVIAILVLVEVWNEFNTKKIINSLKELSSPSVIVVRNGSNIEIKTSELVKGDIILLKTGNRIPADCRLVEANSLEVNESILTGESFPVDKSVEKVEDETPLSERSSMVYSGSITVNGTGKAVAVGVGRNTEMGRIGKLAEEVKEPRTFLQLLMKKLVKIVLLISILASSSVTIIAILEGQNVQKMILTGFSLAFATIPEELPIVIVIMLAVTAYTLTKRKMFVKKLRGLETLAGVTVIATDKTGTITQGRMSLEEIYTDGSVKKFNEKMKTKTIERLLEIGASVNDAVKLENGYNGDPIDIAMLELSKPGTKLEKQFPLENGVLSQVRSNKSKYIFVKGSPEKILEKSGFVNGKKKTAQEEKKIKKVIEQMTEKGLRVIGFAEREIKKIGDRSEIEKNLDFVGLAGFIDPPRLEVKNSIENAEKAGIKVVMITGDHPLTAEALAEKVGIKGGVITGSELDGMSDEELENRMEKTKVYARINPEQKLRIINALRKTEIVAMTGDGVNDALALKAADVGIALGSGSDIAKEASDIVLVENDFSIIIEAVRLARKSFDNTQKGIKYYLACKTALILIFILPILLSVPLPLAPIQIIFMELFMDLAASSAYIYEPEEENLMKEKPRKLENFLDFENKIDIVKGSLSLFIAVSFVYFFTLSNGASVLQAQTSALFTWLLTHVLLALNMKSKTSLSKTWRDNKIILFWAAGVAIALVLLTIFTPPELFVVSITISEWILVLIASFVSTFWMEVVKTFKRASSS